MMIEQGFGPYNLGEVVDEFVARGGGRSNQEIVRQYVAHSGECMDNMLAVAKEMGVDPRAYTYGNTPDGWLIIQANVDYDKYQETGDMYASLRKNYPIKPGTKTWAASHQFMGVYNDEPIMGVAANSVLPLINQALITKAQKDFGADYYFGVAGIKLIQNENGDVTGAYVQDTATGEFWKVNTTKGVVVCGGDYAGNADMCWATLNEKMEKAEQGYSDVACANTIEELFDMLGLYEDPAVRATAIEQIKHYNELCYAGSDNDYGKDASAMIAVDEGPFYGMTASFGPGSTTPMMVTMSGMLTNDDLQVLDAAGEPIKGLYVAGNCLGGRYGTGYSTPCAGNSIGFAGTHGRIAGQNAAKA